MSSDGYDVYEVYNYEQRSFIVLIAASAKSCKYMFEPGKPEPGKHASFVAMATKSPLTFCYTKGAHLGCLATDYATLKTFMQRQRRRDQESSSESVQRAAFALVEQRYVVGNQQAGSVSGSKPSGFTRGSATGKNDASQRAASVSGSQLSGSTLVPLKPAKAPSTSVPSRPPATLEQSRPPAPPSSAVAGSIADWNYVKPTRQSSGSVSGSTALGSPSIAPS